MSNPIPRSGFFATPENFEDLLFQLENISGNDTERRLAFIGAMMALNLAHKLVDKEVADIV